MKTKISTGVFILLLCVSVFSCKKYASLKDDMYSVNKVWITKSSDLPADTLSNNASGQKAIRISINTLEQLEAIEQDTSIVIFHYCTPEDPDGPQPVRYSPSTRGGGALVCDADISPDIYLYPVDVYWPNEKYIPDTIEYSIINDSLLLSLPTEKDRITRHPDFPLQPASIDGQVRAYDNRLLDYVPVGHAKIKYYQRQGSNEVLQYTTTDSTGNFILEVPAVYRDVELLLQNSNYIVRNGNTSEVKSISLGAPSFNYFGPLGEAGNTEPRINVLPSFMQRDLSSDYFLDVYNAAHYYFYGSNELLNQVTRYSSASAISVFAVNEPSGTNTLASFNYSSTPFITVYNAYVSNYLERASYIFGNLLHELGHATMYTYLGASTYPTVAKVIRESFAEFFGWLNVFHYYSSVAPSHGSVNSICLCGQQTWQALSDTLVYTPFYVDLYDNYNQSIYYPYLDVVNDSISAVPVSIILNLALGYTSFSTVCNQLASYTNIYFNTTQYSSFVTPYSIFQ